MLVIDDKQLASGAGELRAPGLVDGVIPAGPFADFEMYVALHSFSFLKLDYLSPVPPILRAEEQTMNDMPTKPYPRTDAEKGQPKPDLGEQQSDLINDGEGENEKGKKQGTDIEHPDLPKGALDEDESNVDPDVERDVESGKENAA